MRLSGRAYHCSAGETFDSIALFAYGSEVYASELLSANPLYCNRLIFTGGEILNLPVIDVVPIDQAEDEFFMPATAPWKE